MEAAEEGDSSEDGSSEVDDATYNAARMESLGAFEMMILESSWQHRIGFPIAHHHQEGAEEGRNPRKAFVTFCVRR